MVPDYPCMAGFLNLDHSSSYLLHLVGHRIQQVWSQPHSQTNQWAEAYLPYIFIFSTGYLCQLSLYWILGTLSTDVKSSARIGIV